MFSGVAVCPFSGWLLKKYANIKVPLGAAQLQDDESDHGKA